MGPLAGNFRASKLLKS